MVNDVENHGENRAFSMIVSSEVKRAGAERRALARGPGGRRFVGLGFGLPVFVLFSGNGGEVFEPIAPAGNGNGLGMVQETIQDRSGGGNVAQKLAPFLQWPVAGHDVSKGVTH